MEGPTELTWKWKCNVHLCTCGWRICPGDGLQPERTLLPQDSSSRTTLSPVSSQIFTFKKLLKKIITLFREEGHQFNVQQNLTLTIVYIRQLTGFSIKETSIQIWCLPL